MSSVECLREFVNEKLNAAVEEIFVVFKKTINEYEEEIDRQRRLLDVCWKPEIKLHRIELPQQHVCSEGEVLCNQEKNSSLEHEEPEPPLIEYLPQQHVCTEEEVLTDQQLYNQERNSSLDQEEPEPPLIKEELEELCTSQEEEQIVLKQETDAFMLSAIYEESDHIDPLPKNDHQLLSNNSHVDANKDPRGGSNGGSTRNYEAGPKRRHHKSKRHSNNVLNSNLPEIHRNTRIGKKSFICGTCGKDLKYKSKLSVHLRVHTGEKPYCCDICGTRFSQISGLNAHMRIHTGEKPHSCNTCGKDFRFSCMLKNHMRIHAGKKRPSGYKRRQPCQPQHVNPPSVWQAIQKYTHQNTELLLSPD